MDDSIHDIKTFVSLTSTPTGHTDYKTKGAHREVRTRGAQAPGGDGKPPPARTAPCELLNGTDRLLAADFTNTRKAGRLFLSPVYFVGCRSPPFLGFCQSKSQKNGGTSPCGKRTKTTGPTNRTSCTGSSRSILRQRYAGQRFSIYGPK